MSLFDVLFIIDLCILLIGWILYVIFGEVTVRKLRKNPETKDALGIDFVSGWDIFNVGMALTLPKKYALRQKKLPFGMLRANPNPLYEHTTRFDRILAKVFFVPFSIAGASGVVLMLLDLFGFFKH
jgi:hypothetical protein